MWKRLAVVPVVGISLGVLVVALAAPPKDPAAGESAAPPKSAPSKITQVTVYPNSALVTREVDVPDGTGVIELVVTSLPPATVNSSLYSEGGDGLRVLTTRFRTRAVKEDTREEVRKLEDELKKLAQTQQRLQAEMNAVQLNMQVYNKLENFTQASTQNATEKGKLDAEAAIALTKYVMEGRTARAKELVDMQQRMQDLQEQQAFVQRQYAELTSGSNKVERDAVIVVDKNRAGAGKVRLNYLVDAASWRPQYKLRAGDKAKDPIQLEYLANVMQQTGEDWGNVHLILSTAQPMLNAAPPDLKVLALNVVPRGTAVASNPPPMPPGFGLGGGFGPGGGKGQGGGESKTDKKDGPPDRPRGEQAQMPGPGDASEKLLESARSGVSAMYALQQKAMDLDQQARYLREIANLERLQKKELAANELDNYAAALQQARDLVVLADEKTVNRGFVPRNDNEGPSVTYHLQSKLTVPSRNDEQVVEVTKFDLASDYCYKAVPVLTRHVYRQANLTNTSKFVLLPGEATMYTGSDFVGRMDLPLVAIGEQFTAGFGVDPQIQVQRQLIDRTRTMQGGNQVLKYDYRILISSFKPEKVKVQVWDRLPHAENETVGVTLGKHEPPLSKDPLYEREEKPNNLLRWDLEVEPGMNGEKAKTVQYDFTLAFDRQMTIGNFLTK
jgi:hypothetical protein